MPSLRQGWRRASKDATSRGRAALAAERGTRIAERGTQHDKSSITAGRIASVATYVFAVAAYIAPLVYACVAAPIEDDRLTLRTPFDAGRARRGNPSPGPGHFDALRHRAEESSRNPLSRLTPCHVAGPVWLDRRHGLNSPVKQAARGGPCGRSALMRNPRFFTRAGVIVCPTGVIRTVQVFA